MYAAMFAYHLKENEHFYKIKASKDRTPNQIRAVEWAEESKWRVFRLGYRVYSNEGTIEAYIKRIQAEHGGKLEILKRGHEAEITFAREEEGIVDAIGKIMAGEKFKEE